MQVRRSGGDRSAAGTAARRGGMASAGRRAAAGQPVGDRPGRRRAGQPARPGRRRAGGRWHRGAVARQHARRRPGAEGCCHARAGQADGRRIRPRGLAGLPLAAHARRRSPRRRRDRRPGRGQTAADQAAGALGDPRPGAARPAAPPAADPDAHVRGAWGGAGGFDGNRRRDGPGGRRRPAHRPSRPHRVGPGARRVAGGAQGGAAAIPAAWSGLAGRDVRDGAGRLPGRRHGTWQDDPGDRPAPAPAGGGSRPHARGVPGVAARHLGARGAQVRPGDPGPPLSRGRQAPGGPGRR